MRKKLFPFITILTLALFLGACNSEDVMPEIGSETNPELTERTISFTASMPGEDDPATRVSAAEEADRGITLTWDENDKLDLLFVQGDNKFHESTTVTNIENGGKNATFTVPLPEGITDDTPYNLYGVYGGGEVDATNPALIGLPAIEGTTLNEENVGKKVMLRFAKEGLNLTDAVGAVNFEHVGFLFTAKIKTISDTAPDITSVQLVGADADNETWAYNASANHFDMEAGTFTAEGTRGNTVNFQNSEKDATNNILTVRNWLPGAQTAFPTLKLSVNETATAETKPARTLEVGRAYYLYAQYDGTDLVFADKDFNVPQTGTKISIAGLRENYVPGGTYAEDHFIEGEVVLNAKNGNVNALAAYVADETAGISFFFTSGDDVVTDAPLGAKVRINLEGATWDSFNGLIQLKSLSTSTAVEILEPTATTPLEPRVVTIQELLDKKYQSELVQVNNVQFKNVPATYGSNPDLIDNNAIEINVRSSSSATFKDENVPEGNGPFIGVVGMYNNAQLHVRETADLADMTGPRYVPPFINVNPFSLTFAKEGGSETIAVTANVSWTATTEASWLTVTPASGTNDGAIAVSVEANTGAEARTATITITDGDVVTIVNVMQAGAEEDPVELLFPGSDFNNWTTFTGSLNRGPLAIGKHSESGGIDGSGAMLIEGTQGSNDYLFTAKVPAGFDATGKTEITFWIKGTSTGRALSMNVYTGTGTTSGTDYKCYNIPSGTTSDVVLEPTGTNNYMGSINTSGEWIKVTLDISSIVDNINATQGQNLFAIKVGKSGVYDLLVDDIMIE